MKINKKSKTLLVMLCLVLTVNLSVFAAEYIHDRHSVDGGGHLDWDTASNFSYTSYVRDAQDIWNGHIEDVVREDNALIVEDVKFKQLNTGDGVAGAYWPDYDSIVLNPHYFDTGNAQSYSTKEKLKTVTHEMGHALGLNENTNPNHSSAIMTQGRSSVNTLHQDDKDSFDAAAATY